MKVYREGRAMNDEAEDKAKDQEQSKGSKPNERLEELKTELFKHFGKLTRWKALCRERDAEAEEDKIRLAEEVLATYSTGTVAEWLSHDLRLQDKKSFNVNDFLSGRTAEKRL